jgi:5-methylcytosine-specific restriction endonuclease McrA
MPYADPKVRSRYNTAYRKKHKKHLDLYNAAYRKAHREENVEYLREWKKDNPDYDREWQKKHRENKRRSQRKFRRTHPERIRAQNAAYATRKTGAGGKFTEQEWLDLKRKYKFRCLRCNRRKKLFPDHVKPVSKGGTSNISNIQPLCGVCNSIKSNKFIDYRKRTR